MKKSQSILVLGFLFGLGSCYVNLRSDYSSGYSFDYQGSTSKLDRQGEIPAEISQVEIDHRFGDVHIDPSPAGSDHGWRWELTTWADDQETASAYLDQISLETVSTGERMSFKLVIPASPGSDLNGIKSVLWLKVAGDTQLELKNKHGDAFLRDLSGAIRSDLSHGDADYQSLSGMLELEHSHGDVKLNDVQTGALNISHGDLIASGFHREFALKAEHGELELSQVEADMALRASHADSNLSGIEGAFHFKGSHSDLLLAGNPESLVLDSSHGDLEVRCEGLNLNSVVADMEHADLVMRLVQGFDVRLKTKTDHGNAVNNFESTAQGKSLSIEVETSHGNFRLLPIKQ